jgi:two-component system chemotaxis sensor kinase CheA
MDDLLAQFLIEGRDLVAQAAGDLAALADDPRAPGAVDSAFRAIHTLKGSVGLFAMGPAEQVLHAAEDVFEGARHGGALDRETIAALIACIDLIDRWIDEMEASGAVGTDAARDATGVLARLDRRPTEAPQAAPDVWIEALAEREQAALSAAAGPLVAFRYTPDPDCFFQGEDPLAIVAAVPDLVSLRILPAEGHWPALAEVEPFRCGSVLEGVSAAPLADVTTAFRLVAHQVVCRALEATAEPERPEAAATSVLRVEAGRLDALADGLGALIVAANALTPIAARAEGPLAAAIRGAQAEIESRIAELHRSVARVRLVPLAPTLRRLPRMVREIAEGLGKPVAFAMRGEQLEVDKQIADALFEPLLHLLRNAIDHGIEDAATRAAAGKPAQGAITLSARREGDTIAVTLADDGAGMDPQRLREVAVARGLLSDAAARELSDAAALRLIFAPGFSTAPVTTAVSGRGVGMDAVQAAVDKLRGSIAIDSTPGQGTRFMLRLPANALTTRLLVVEAGGERYGVALDQIVETVRVGQEALLPVGEGLACVLRGRTVPVLSLAALLGGTQAESPHAKLLVTRSAGERVALRVDGFAERLDTVVRPPSGLLANLPGIAGSALMGDGGVLLVLDLPELAA